MEKISNDFIKSTNTKIDETNLDAFIAELETRTEYSCKGKGSCQDKDCSTLGGGGCYV